MDDSVQINFGGTHSFENEDNVYDIASNKIKNENDNISNKNFKSQRYGLEMEKTSFDDKVFACTECAYKFSQKSNLNVHIKRQHSAIKDYNCEYCDYRTVRRERLTAHIISKQ